MTIPPDGSSRVYRLPVSGDVLQWRPDGLSRLVPAAQYESERSLSPELAPTWHDPASVGRGISGDRYEASGDGDRGWWRWFGKVPAEGSVTARYADGTEAPVVVAGPVWCVEGFADRELDSIEVAGRTFDPRRSRVAHDALLGRLGDDPSAADGGGWWTRPPGDAPPVVRPVDRLAAAEPQRGLALLVWEEYSEERRQFPRDT